MINNFAKRLLKFFKLLVIFLLVFTLYVVIARMMYKLPAVDHTQNTQSVILNKNTFLGQQISSLGADHQGLSGIKVLLQGMDAFTIRMFLIKNAMHSIDAQYYIWHNDLTGLLMFSALKDAADRGVQVRLLLDDNGIDHLDEIIAQLNSHPLIDIRLYNPFMIRGIKLINFTFDFFRLNRRMHNKALIVDGVAAISGGRNIGDEYFGTGKNAHFVDLDILTVGQVVPSMAKNFNIFYNSKVSIPVDLMLKPYFTYESMNSLSGALSLFVDSEQFKTYTQEIQSSQFLQDIKNGQLIDEWTEVTMISDDPRKTLGIHYENELMVERLNMILNSPINNIDVVSPYFVPGDAVDVFTKLQENRVDVRILTNAFEATDVVPVHSGYAKYRHKLMAAGVQLFELKARQFIKDKDMGIMGSSAASLHAKTFAVDGKLAFIGSFNFDPRSTMLNTEMGVVIKSKNVARRVHQYFDDAVTADAYQLKLDDDDNLIWFEAIGEKEYRQFAQDPYSTWLQRAAIKFLGMLPIEWLL